MTDTRNKDFAEYPSIKWDNRFLELANVAAGWSKDPNKQVGCVIVSPDGRQLTMGFNGFPSGLHDDPVDLGNKSIKNRFMVHAEQNAIFNARGSVEGWVLYCTHAPCLSHGCALAIIQSGIARVVHPKIDPGSSWSLEQHEAQLVMLRAGVLVTERDTQGRYDYYGT